MNKTSKRTGNKSMLESLLMAIAVLLIIIAVCTMLVINSREQLNVLQADEAATAISQFANQVSGMSHGSKLKARIAVPGSISRVSYGEDEVLLESNSNSIQSNFRKTIRKPLLGFKFMNDEQVKKGTYNIIFENYPDYVCAYTPDRRDEYCAEARTTGLSERSSEPDVREYREGLLVSDDIDISTSKPLDIEDYYLAEGRFMCNSSKANAFPKSECRIGNGENQVHCNITIDSEFPSYKFDNTAIIKGCVRLLGEWRQSKLEYLIIRTMCGDGRVTGNEECEDNNTNTSDNCPLCMIARCGDGYLLDGIEECDDGNNVSGDGCSSQCMHEFCGDGIITKTNPNGYYKDRNITLPEDCEQFLDTVHCKVGQCICKTHYIADLENPGKCKLI